MSWTFPDSKRFRWPVHRCERIRWILSPISPIDVSSLVWSQAADPDNPWELRVKLQEEASLGRRRNVSPTSSALCFLSLRGGASASSFLLFFLLFFF